MTPTPPAGLRTWDDAVATVAGLAHNVDPVDVLDCLAGAARLIADLLPPHPNRTPNPEKLLGNLAAAGVLLRPQLVDAAGALIDPDPITAMTLTDPATHTGRLWLALDYVTRAARATSPDARRGLTTGAYTVLSRLWDATTLTLGSPR